MTPSAPPARRSYLSWPATWLFVVLTIIGVVVLGRAFGPAVASNPVAFTAAVILFGIHAAVFIAIIRTVDWLEPEPKRYLALAMLWGGVIASSNALRANTAVESILVKIAPLDFVRDWAAAFEGPTDEEILKTLGIVAIVLLARPQINSILDGVVYGAFVGLGFQEVENLTYSLNAVAQAGTDSVGPVLQVFFVRGLLAGLWSHTVYSAIAGAGVAYAVLRRDKSWAVRIGMALLALFVAWCCHFLWNSPALSSISALPGGFGVIAAILLKGGLILGAFLILLYVVRRGEFRVLGSELARLRDPALATPGEIGALRTARLRGVARWNSWVLGGHPARLATKRLQRAQANLAVAMRDDTAAVPARIPGVRDARRRLLERGVTDANAIRRSTVLGWVSFVFSFGVLVNVFVAVVPVALLLIGVDTARRRHRRADPRLRTAVIMSLVFGVIWLIDFLARNAGVQ
jgi:RsiW-degrading membrane proteinase PrsW (M82 family)